MTTHNAIIGVLLAGLLCTQGCSFMFVDGPPAQPMARDGATARAKPIRCTDSNAWPVVDAIWATLNGLGALSAMSAEEGEIENPDQVIGVGLAWLAISGASAIWGASQVSKCRKAKAAQFEQFAGAQLVPVADPTAMSSDAEQLRLPPIVVPAHGQPPASQPDATH